MSGRCAVFTPNLKLLLTVYPWFSQIPESCSVCITFWQYQLTFVWPKSIREKKKEKKLNLGNTWTFITLNNKLNNQFIAHSQPTAPSPLSQLSCDDLNVGLQPFRCLGLHNESWGFYVPTNCRQYDKEPFCFKYVYRLVLLWMLKGLKVIFIWIYIQEL